MKHHKKFLKKAIEKSKESADKGLFPAGSIVVCNNTILALEISSPYPDHRHADTKAVDNAYDMNNGPLDECILYASMEPCLMCISRAYWSGISKIVYAISKNQVPSSYFEGDFNQKEIIQKFNENIELIHLKELQEEALEVVKEWEQKNN